MGRKNNRVRHGQLRTDIDQHGQLGADIAAPTATDATGGDENRPVGAAVLDPAQPPADPGDGSADAQQLEPLGGDGGEPPSETDPVSTVGQAGQPAEEQAAEVTTAVRLAWADDIVAAVFAGSHCFSADDYWGAFMIMDDHDGPLPDGRDQEVYERASCAAEFVRQNPDAPAEAISIHLRLKGYKAVPTSGLLTGAAWRVFAFTLQQRDAVRREVAKQLVQQPAEPAPAWPGDLTMQPQPGAFDAAGFSPRR